MATAGWYGDPTRVGRLRYWDGSAWTEHVSEGGGTAVDPIAGIPPAPPAGSPVGAAAEAASEQPVAADATRVSSRVDAAAGAASADAGAAPAAGGPYPPTLFARIGFVVAAVGGVLTAASAGSTAVDQQGLVTISVAGGSWIGVVAAVVGVAAAAAPWPWARVAGVTASGAFALLVALALIGFRTSDDLVPGVDVSLGTAGWLMLSGSILLFVGTAIALVWFRVPARGPDPSRSPSNGKSVTSMILGIVGVLIPVAAAPAVGVGLFALDDISASGGRLSGRRFARAGIVLGALSLIGWGIGLTLGMLLTQP